MADAKNDQTYDRAQAEEILESFNRVSGLGVTLFVPDTKNGRVQVDYTKDACAGRCPFCLSKDSDGMREDGAYWGPACQRVHSAASEFADSFGGRYFYQCDQDRIFFAAPVVADGGLAAAMTIGPVHIFEEEKSRIEGEGLRPFPVRKPMYIQYLSNLLSACAVSVSDSSQNHLRYVKQATMEQQRDIHGSIMRNKQTPVREYPISCEIRLVQAIQQCDAVSARMLLNELLGMLLSSGFASNFSSFQQRADELIIACSRGALYAGVSTSAVMDTVGTYRNGLAHQKTNERICFFLQRYVEQLIFLVSRLKDVSCEDDIYRAVEYIRAHYNRKLGLEEVASEVGFSPSYFSRLFKKKMGCNYNVYLNQVRIDASKNSLLSTDLTVSEIAQLSGFEDVSYFTRTFKRLVGVAPGYYRLHRGQVDKEKERG